MWRHGTVHQLKPDSYRAPLTDKSENQVEVKWISSKHNRKRERANHMLLFPMENMNNVVYLHMNSCQLADDLVYAVNRMIDALREGKLDKHACSKRIVELQKTLDYTYEKLSGWVVNPIKDQIREAWRQKGGMLDQNGNVIKKHPKSRHLT